MQDGSYPSLSQLNDRSKGNKIYEVGYTLIEYILQQYGRAELVRLIKNYGDLRKVWGITEA